MREEDFRQKGKPLQLALARLNATGLAESRATPAVVDMSRVKEPIARPTGRPRDKEPTGYNPDGYSLKKQQQYKRMRRLKDRMDKVTLGSSVAEQVVKFKKPLAEWDNEELARGRPRDKDGRFRGSAPAWVSGEIHEEAMDRFTSIVKTGMRVATVDAIEVIKSILNDESVDNRGRNVVGAGTKLDAAKFLIEHVVGKPTQRIESDVSVKLQAILGVVMANPTEMATGYVPAHLPGLTMQLAEAANDDEELLEDSDG
jgi:hypothetical protein